MKTLHALLMKDTNHSNDFVVYHLYEDRNQAEKMLKDFIDYDEEKGYTNFEYKIQYCIDVIK